MSVTTRPPRRSDRLRPQARPVQPEQLEEQNTDQSSVFRLPHGLASWRFGMIVGCILAVGLVTLLAVNTSLARAAIELSGLESTLARQTEAQQALAASVEEMSSPASLQQAAVDLGMVPAAAPAFLDPATGRVSGAMTPAVAPAKPPVQAPQVTAVTPTPTPEPSAAARPGPAQPTPSPVPTAAAPVDPGVDGATITRPEDAAVGPTPAATPAPPARGDSANLVPRAGG